MLPQKKTRNRVSKKVLSVYEFFKTKGGYRALLWLELREIAKLRKVSYKTVWLAKEKFEIEFGRIEGKTIKSRME